MVELLASDREQRKTAAAFQKEWLEQYGLDGVVLDEKMAASYDRHALGHMVEIMGRKMNPLNGAIKEIKSQLYRGNTAPAWKFLQASMEEEDMAAWCRDFEMAAECSRNARR